MSAPPASMPPLTDKNVAPGESVVISMPLTAPNSAGAYKAEFKLRSAEGVVFAFRNIEHTFWVEIQVRGDVINLADSYCSATWSSAVGTLPCPGKAGDAGGFVYSDPAPRDLKMAQPTMNPPFGWACKTRMIHISRQFFPA